MSVFLSAAGDPIAKEDLRARRAKALIGYLESPSATYASLFEVRAIGNYDVVVMELDVERPQKTVHDIASKERLAIVFDSESDVLPSVLALREDFPLVPHINRTSAEKPRSLCLYDEQWPQARLSWTAAGFVRRIRTWLADTAVGQLHRDDQILEPLVMSTEWRLILPANMNPSILGSEAKVMSLLSAGEHTFVVLPEGQQNVNAQTLLFAIATPATCHGIVRRTPSNLKELHELLSGFGLDLAEALRVRIRDWKTARANNPILKLKPILVVALPKCRIEGGSVETTEFLAFVFGTKIIEDLGIALSVLSKEGTGITTGVLIGATASLEQLADLELAPMQVLAGLKRTDAAKYNDTPVFDGTVFAIGMGALGSQIFNNLLRSGFGTWKVVDDDTFAPHNAARHLFPAGAVGVEKARLITQLSRTFEWEVVRNVEIRDALTLTSGDFVGSSAIFDFSASVPVSRHLANCEGLEARCIAAFITPGGSGLVLLVEDRSRRVRLDWLEMLHYRQVLNNPVAIDTMVAPNRSRYGNGCRDVSAILSQDDVSLWASTASRALKKQVQSDGAALLFWKRDPESGAVMSDAISPPRFARVLMGEWTVVYDDWLRDKLARYRAAKLPNETGGILIGHFDVQNSICYLVDALPSPGDSVEWPTAYYRGIEGLRDSVVDIEKRTLGQTTYVGEWHSHPDGCRARPSEDDLTAYGWLIEYMNSDSYPAIMVIVGQAGELGIVAAEPLT
ncbi:MAG: hypothetical protein QOE70_939 [Chthoniobacter sp.]|jgi:proteasome lid subunit RPN8/RPN11|nr:hypothetical protein [Chthoniobacter sp.]